MPLLRLHHAEITIPRDAEDAGREFYCGLLGLREIPKPDSLRQRGGFWVRLGDIDLHVGVEDGVDRAATKVHLAYEVDDVPAWRQRVKGAGLKPIDSIPIPGYERFEFRDPFGNRIEMIQRVV